MIKEIGSNATLYKNAKNEEYKDINLKTNIDNNSEKTPKKTKEIEFNTSNIIG